MLILRSVDFNHTSLADDEQAKSIET